MDSKYYIAMPLFLGTKPTTHKQTRSRLHEEKMEHTNPWIIMINYTKVRAFVMNPYNELYSFISLKRVYLVNSKLFSVK